MLIHLLVKFRKFKISERKDSGYFSGLDSKRATIDVNNADNLEEQIGTLIHEFVHFLIRFFITYECVKQRYTSRTKDVSQKWWEYDRKSNKEEQLCQEIEKTVIEVLKKRISKELWQEYFK